MPTPSHRRARRRGMILGSAISSRRARTAATPASPVSQAQPAPAAPDITSQLTELKTLLDNGIITQADFDAKKSKILGV